MGGAGAPDDIDQAHRTQVWLAVGDDPAARVSGACFVMGEAAATAVHLALADDVDPTGVDVRQLQRTLSKNGVFLGMETA